MDKQPHASPEFYVERLEAYDEQDARELGLLRPHLSASFTGEPVDEALLRDIIDSPYHEQLVARTRDEHTRIFGAATLSIVVGAMTGKKGYLEDFVTDPDTGIRGGGQALWNEMGAWCQERDIDLHFTSRSDRTAAHNFYEKNGAKIRDTTVFRKNWSD
jgi:GNAT superfamily N-acetyltransferase